MLVTKKHILDLCKDLYNLRRTKFRVVCSMVGSGFIFDPEQSEEWNTKEVARHNTKFHTEKAELENKIKATIEMTSNAVIAYIRSLFECSEDTANEIIEKSCEAIGTNYYAALQGRAEYDYEEYIEPILAFIDDLYELCNKIKEDSAKGD